MVITPNSKVKLIKNPLKLDSNNEMMFATATAQYNYFTSLPKLEFDSLTYVRKDDILRIPTDETGVGTTFEKLLAYNFCMYQNTAFGNKWFYAFIDDVKWINPSLTEVHLTTAYYQTWQFDLIYKDSFIEREHVNDDTIGLHTIPEMLEKGEYVPSDESFFIYNNGLSGMDWVPCIGVSENVFTQNQIKVYNNTYSGLQYFALEDSSSIAAFLNYYAKEGKVEEIYTLFIIPIAFISDSVITFQWDTKTFEYKGSTWTVHYKEVPSSYNAFNLGTMQLSRPSQLGIGSNKYTPKNNKMLTGDYIYILADNMCGSVAQYKYEYFTNPAACTFECKGAINSGCSIKMYPKNYKTITNGYSEGLTGAKIPVCSWTTDIYTNWLTSHAIDIPMKIAGSLLSLGTGLATGNVAKATSGIDAIMGTTSEIYQHSLAPYQAQGNTNVGDVMYAMSSITPQFYKMTIKQEYAKIIDDYLSMFGYKVNRVGTPHLHVRTYYDFIKTIDVNIEGDVPEHDLEEIRKMFNRGIRFWHNTSYYLNFSVNNSIIS